MGGIFDKWDGRGNLPVSADNNRSAAPAYPYWHSGPCVVCGFAETLRYDLGRVYRARGSLPTISVNGAMSVVKSFAVYSFHFEPGKLNKWAKRQREKFGENFTVHAPGKADWLYHNQKNYPWVDHWWHETSSRGSSGWCAVRLAKLMGFDEVILCGMPLDARPYANKKPAWWFQNPGTDAVEVFQKAVKEDTAYHAGVSSMSGWTRSVFGEPEWLSAVA